MASYYVELNGGDIAPKTELTGGLITPSVSFSGAQIYPVSGGGGSAILQTKSVSYTPSETAISDAVNPDPGYDGLNKVNVSVDAIPSNYVGTAIDRWSSSDLTASGATVTAPAGYYSSSASKAVASGSVVVDDESITISSPFSFDATTGKISSHILNSYTATATVTDGYVSSATSGNIHVYTNKDQQLDVVGATTYTPSTTDQTIPAQKYLTGAQTILGDANLIASNIVSGVTIFGVTGTAQTGGGWVEETISTSGAVTKALDPYTLYHFTGTLTSLTITLNAPSAGEIAHYHFDFLSGSTAPTLTMPNTVTMPDSFAVEASKRYEVDVLNNFGTVVEWAN